MLVSIFGTLFLALAATAAPAPQDAAADADAKRKPLCSKVDQPCRCPSGATFRNTTTHAVIGATAKDIAAITNDYFNVTWCGLEIRNTKGPDNTVGTERGVAQIGGSIVVNETLDVYSVDRDGSFVQKYSQILKNGQPQILVPADQPGGPIGLDGYWNTFIVTDVGKKNKKASSTVSFNEYRCDIGSPFSSEPFQQYAINNTISILQSQGKLTGKTIYPYTDATQG